MSLAVGMGSISRGFVWMGEEVVCEVEDWGRLGEVEELVVKEASVWGLSQTENCLNEDACLLGPCCQEAF
jgi:hypothetical protein